MTQIISTIRKAAKFLFLLTISFLFGYGKTHATVAILRASGGTISADKAANAAVPAYTTLGNIRLTEALIADFSVGTNVTLTVNAPAGWQFNTAAAVTVTNINGRDISAATILSKTASVITIQLSVGGITKLDVLTISAIQIRANDGANVPGTTNLTSGGTAVIAGCAAGTNLGNLGESIGAIYRLVLTLPGQVNTDATTLAGSCVTGAVTNSGY